MSQEKPKPTTTPTSKVTWEDVEGVIHYGVSQPHTAKAFDKIDLLTPCRGFLRGWPASCLRPADTIITCILCHSTAWAQEIERMEHAGLINAMTTSNVTNGTVLHTLIEKGAFIEDALQPAQPWR